MPTRQTYLELATQSLSTLKTKFFFKKGEIDVLYSPIEFYEILKKKISHAEDKIFIASLYIGKSEDELINCIREALNKKPKLKVYFLIDGLRGTREAPSGCSTTLLSGLLKGHEDRVDIRLYRTPAFVGLKGLIAPKRINEGLGLQHMKIYGFDNEVLLSGANLSADYFTNRQDRYYLFQSAPFSNYYFRLHQIISKLSYKVRHADNAEKFTVSWPLSNPAIEPTKNRTKFIRQSSNLLNDFLNIPSDEVTSEEKNAIASNDEYSTVVFPISQFTPLFSKGHDHSTERPSILRLISSISKPTLKWTFTAGYFNMLPDIKKGLISSPSKLGTVITASPFANGFFQSKGVSGHLPGAYLYLSKMFLEMVKMHGKEAEINLREWKKGVVNKPGGWSYHAKGIWVSEKVEDSYRPVATCVGSSNYTQRAYSLDLESNAIILTSDLELRDKMQQELDNILQHTSSVSLEDFENDPERHISTGVKVATRILGKRL